MLPVLISQLVVVLKDTALGVLITFLEIVRQGTQSARRSATTPGADRDRDPDDLVNFALSELATRLEHQMRRSRRGPPPMHRTSA